MLSAADLEFPVAHNEELDGDTLVQTVVQLCAQKLKVLLYPYKKMAMHLLGINLIGRHGPGIKKDSSCWITRDFPACRPPLTWI